MTFQRNTQLFTGHAIYIILKYILISTAKYKQQIGNNT